MDAPSFSGLLIVVAVAFALAFALGLVPRVKLRPSCSSSCSGSSCGPAVPGGVQIDETISVIALVGLVFLLGGLEIEFEQLRGRVLKLAAQGWPAAFAIAVAVGYALKGAGLVQAPLLGGDPVAQETTAAQRFATATWRSGPTVSARLPSSSSSSSSPTTLRRQPCSVRTSGGGRPSRIASTMRCRSARAAISS